MVYIVLAIYELFVIAVRVAGAKWIWEILIEDRINIKFDPFVAAGVLLIFSVMVSGLPKESSPHQDSIDWSELFHGILSQIVIVFTMVAAAWASPFVLNLFF